MIPINGSIFVIVINTIYLLNIIFMIIDNVLRIYEMTEHGRDTRTNCVIAIFNNFYREDGI